MGASSDNSNTNGALSWLRAHLIALSVVVGLLLLYTLGGFLLVPHIVRTQAIAYVQHELGRQLTIGSVKFNPFLFKIEIQQLNLAEADGAPIVTLSLLRVEFNAMASLLHRAWTLGEVRLEQPSISVLVNHDGSLNLAKLAPPSKEPPSPPSTTLPRVRIGLFSVQQGRLHFEDRSREQPFTATLSPIEFDLNDFRTQPDFENRYRFSAATAAGETLDWAGQFDLRPLASNGEFSIGGLKASTIAAYLEDSVPFALNSGTLDLKGQYQFVSQGNSGPSVSVTLPSVQVHALAIAPKQADATATPWILLPELDITDTRVALGEHTVGVGEISAQKPAVQVWREANGSLNLQTLTGASKASATDATGTTPTATPQTAGASVTTTPAAAPWRVTLAKLSITDADIAAEDRSLNPAMKLHIAPLNFTVQNASSEGNQPLSFDLAAGLGETGHLHTAGTVTLTPLLAEVGIELKDLDLSQLQPYILQQANMTIYRGNAASDLKIVYVDKPGKGQPQLKVSGSAQVVDLATRDNVTNTDFITWTGLELSGLRYQMNPNSLDINRVHARGLYSRVLVTPNGTINIKDVMQPGGAGGAPGAAPAAPAAAQLKPAAAKPPATASAPTMPTRIKRIDIEDSTANFSDRSIEPNFSAAIVNLHGSITGLSSAPSARARITLDGNVDQYSPVVIRGEVNPFAASGYTDLSLSFHNMELTTFNPYSGKYAGYSIDQGKLSTDLHYHIENRKLDATHHIVVDQLEFGAATQSKQAVPLPIKLAVAILKDRNGVITLDLPQITGTIDDPQFRLGPMIWTFLVDLLKKVVTAPFSALGKLFGGGEEMSYVDFPAGAATLNDSDVQKLAQLSKALIERPQLKLDVPLHTASESDDAIMAKAALDQAVTDATSTTSTGKRAAKKAAAASGAGPSGTGANADQTLRLTALALLYRQKFKAEPEYPGEQGGKPANANDPNATPAAHVSWLEQQLLPQFQPNPDQRNALGRARAGAAQNALLANKELLPERVFLTERESGGGPDGQVRMELKLQ